MGEKFWQWGPSFAAKIGPVRPILAAKVVWGNNFGRFSARIGSAGPILGGTDFGVTEDQLV